MANLCIIPARGGSKRIPKKNIKNFDGKPAITFAINAAIKSNLFTEIMVSTDSNEIAMVAKKYGAKVPFLRSEQNSDDFSGTDAVIKEVLDKYMKNGISFDTACCIYPVNPFLNGDKLINGFKTLQDSKLDSVISAVKYSYPIQRSFRQKDGKAYMIEPEYYKCRSQDLAPTFHDAAQFYWFKIKPFFKNGRIWNDNTGIIELNELEVQDIDNETDWKLAELKYKLLYQDHK
jgi:pseudaminic acid cytidylyltransferase